jgi:two-component system, LuxR family, sensor kinase FixL
MAGISTERFSRYAFPLTAASLLAGAGLRFILEPLTGFFAGYLYFLPAIVIGAATGGAPPALAATLIGTILGMVAVGHDGLSAFDLFLAGIFYSNGLLIATIGALLRRRHAETLATAQELRLREAQLKSILDTVPDAMIVFDQDGTIKSFSATAEGMFQWRADEIIGRSVTSLLPKVHISGHDGYPAIDLSLYNKDALRRRRPVLGQRKDKSRFPIELTVGEVRSSPPLYTAFAYDLTFEKESQAKLESLQTELAHIARLNAMGEMAAMLAHELNQPLAAIINYQGGLARMLESGRNISPNALLPPLQKASAEALRAGEIIHGIQSFVSKRAGERETARLDALVSEACSLALVGIDPAKFSVRIQVAPELKPVVVDKIQIQQVLLNLVRNALEAMEEEEAGEVVIGGRSDDENSAEISVSDTGFGIPAPIADNLFKPFVTSKPDGMGLGLSICRRIIESHGGKIWVEPNSPQGSIFRFTLPTSRGTG